MNSTFFIDYELSLENILINYVLVILIVLLYIFYFILKYFYSFIFTDNVAN